MASTEFTMKITKKPRYGSSKGRKFFFAILNEAGKQGPRVTGMFCRERAAISVEGEQRFLEAAVYDWT